jgi:hypothetical protein
MKWRNENHEDYQDWHSRRGRVGSGSVQAVAADGKNDKAKTVYAAHTQTNVPYDFVNEKGESDGYEIAVSRQSTSFCRSTNSSSCRPRTRIS